MTPVQVEAIIGLRTEHNVLTNESGILYLEEAWVDHDESYVVIAYTIAEDAWIVSDKKAFNIPY